jgi:hypothetical protein
METDSDVLFEMERATRREISLSEFEDWFVGRTWEMDSPLLRNVTGLLAESSGNDGDAAVLEAFERMLVQPTATVPVSFGSAVSGVSAFISVQAGSSTFGAVVVGNPGGWTHVIRQETYRVPA